MPRSKSLALARKAKAVRLRKEGHSWDEVADGSGYANRGTAYRVVTNAHREQIVEDIESYRASELERLTFLESELLEIAATSKSDSAKIRALSEVRAIGRDRCKLLALYDHAPAAEPQMLIDPRRARQLKEGNTCRIDGGTSCDFIPEFHEKGCATEMMRLAQVQAE